jgi:hypothetical protein
MAISFKTDKDYAFGLLSLFGVSKSLLTTAQDSGVTVSQSAPGTFVVKNPEGVTKGTVYVKGSAISLAKGGTLGPASKQAIQAQFESALNEALIGSAKPAMPVSPTSINEMLKAKYSTSTPEPAPHSQPAAKATGTVHLEQATSLNQPVFGSTAGSVYRVFALFDGLAIAARLKGTKLSIRAAGAKHQQYKAALQSFGFDMKDSYMSGHFDCGNHDLVCKAFGAIIGMIGYDQVKQAANFKAWIASGGN